MPHPHLTSVLDDAGLASLDKRAEAASSSSSSSSRQRCFPSSKRQQGYSKSTQGLGSAGIPVPEDERPRPREQATLLKLAQLLLRKARNSKTVCAGEAAREGEGQGGQGAIARVCGREGQGQRACECARAALPSPRHTLCAWRSFPPSQKAARAGFYRLLRYVTCKYYAEASTRDV